MDCLAMLFCGETNQLKPGVIFVVNKLGRIELRDHNWKQITHHDGYVNSFSKIPPDLYKLICNDTERTIKVPNGTVSYRTKNGMRQKTYKCNGKTFVVNFTELF